MKKSYQIPSFDIMKLDTVENITADETMSNLNYNEGIENYH